MKNSYRPDSFIQPLLFASKMRYLGKPDQRGIVLESAGAQDSGDDFVSFLDDVEHDEQPDSSAPPIVVLIVDDDRAVHDATLFALGGERIRGRSMEFLHAYSAEEARKVVEARADIALILLDVVMGTSDAGLRLIPVIRDMLGRPDIKIIVRTGQPGYAPESHVAQHYAVDGYVMKARLTRAMLLDAVVTALGGSGPSTEGKISQ